MLKQLLALLETGGAWQVTELATALDTSPDLVHAMLNHLAQSGKLDMPEQTCAGTCAGCSLQSACKAGSSNHTFVYISRTLKSSEGGNGKERE